MALEPKLWNIQDHITSPVRQIVDLEAAFEDCDPWVPLLRPPATSPRRVARGDRGKSRRDQGEQMRVLNQKLKVEPDGASA